MVRYNIYSGFYTIIILYLGTYYYLDIKVKEVSKQGKHYRTWRISYKIKLLFVRDVGNLYYILYLSILCGYL